jgi:DNA primase
MSTQIVPTKSQKKQLAAAVQEYHSQLPGSDAEEYLLSERHLTREALDSFCLGVVQNPLKGDEEFAGRICIPYLTAGGTVSLRFRACGDDGSGPKYLSRAGDPGRPYNVSVLRSDVLRVYITEGELDAITCWMAGLPAVGIRGATSWRNCYSRLFRWREVVVLADGDTAGREFAAELTQKIDGCKIMDMGESMDVNSYFVAKGAEGLREYING